MFFWGDGTHLQEYKAPQHKRPQYEQSPPRKPEQFYIL
jgi:hypothetical protein